MSGTVYEYLDMTEMMNDGNATTFLCHSVVCPNQSSNYYQAAERTPNTLYFERMNQCDTRKTENGWIAKLPSET